MTRQNAGIAGGAGELHVFPAHQELLHKAAASLGGLSASFEQIVMGAAAQSWNLKLWTIPLFTGVKLH